MNGKAVRLYAGVSASTASSAGSDVSVRATPTFVEVALEQAILAALDASPSASETMLAGFQRKERALVQLFAQLSVSDARTLHRRLTLPVDSDPIASRFARLISERRARLIAFLADARRREAIAVARSH
jgi:hypothetical protein